MSDHQLPPGQEIVRVIKTDNGLCVVLTPLVFARASTWGIVIADIARNAALMYAQEDADTDADTKLREIRAMLDAELDAPSASVEPLPRTD